MEIHDQGTGEVLVGGSASGHVSRQAAAPTELALSFIEAGFQRAIGDLSRVAGAGPRPDRPPPARFGVRASAPLLALRAPRAEGG